MRKEDEFFDYAGIFLLLLRILHLICYMDAVLSDPGEFCRKNQIHQGKIQVADLARLSAVCASKSGELAWAVEGKLSPAGHLQLDLAVTGRVELVCQRCLEPFSLALDACTSILLAGSEKEADEIEDMLPEDDLTEVIVGDKTVDLLVLVEDEALLTLPLSPRHETCPNAGAFAASQKRESPFAVLKGLKTGKEGKN